MTNIFMRRNSILPLTFNPGLTLASFQTTQLRSLQHDLLVIH